MRESGYINTFEGGDLDDDDAEYWIDDGVLDEERRVYTCPSCAGVNIIFQGRCIVCTDCGWSSCVL